jgi:hypothetical protein
MAPQLTRRRMDSGVRWTCCIRGVTSHVRRKGIGVATSVARTQTGKRSRKLPSKKVEVDKPRRGRRRRYLMMSKLAGPGGCLSQKLVRYVLGKIDTESSSWSLTYETQDDMAHTAKAQHTTRGSCQGPGSCLHGVGWLDIACDKTDQLQKRGGVCCDRENTHK